MVGSRKVVETACNLMKGALYYVGNSIRACVLSCQNIAANLRTLNVNVLVIKNVNDNVLELSPTYTLPIFLILS